MSKTVTDAEVANLSDDELMRLEREIARKYMAGLSIPMVLWPIFNVGIWLALWPLVISGTVSLWVAAPIALLNMMLAYLPSHDAQHDSYARPGQRLRWLNQTIGHVSSALLANSYRILRETHLEHHRHANKPGLDPDYVSHSGKTAWETLWNSLMSMQPDTPASSTYLATIERLDNENCRKGKRDQAIITISHFGILFAMAANGMALEAFFLWWLPLKLAVFYLQFYLSWAPHRDMGTGRYRDTRSFRSIGGTWWTSGMTAHVVHHLHPRIPMDRTPAAFKEMLPVLRARQVDVAGR